jgi:predicted PurR-regulated permease PerM
LAVALLCGMLVFVCWAMQSFLHAFLWAVLLGGLLHPFKRYGRTSSVPSICA